MCGFVYMSTGAPNRPEEGLGSGVTNDCKHQMGAGNPIQVLRKNDSFPLSPVDTSPPNNRVPPWGCYSFAFFSPYLLFSFVHHALLLPPISLCVCVCVWGAERLCLSCSLSVYVRGWVPWLAHFCSCRFFRTEHLSWDLRYPVNICSLCQGEEE